LPIKGFQDRQKRQSAYFGLYAFIWRYSSIAVILYVSYIEVAPRNTANGKPGEGERESGKKKFSAYSLKFDVSG
jgi:hypothetical protein